MTPWARWRLADPRALTDRVNGTWAAERDGLPVIVKFFTEQDWRYPLRVAAALRAQGWPTPEPIEEQLVVAAAASDLIARLTGRPRDPVASCDTSAGYSLMKVG
ncbi:hypothetical protein [Actinoplanes philippinensis]|uniref:hypothetical protein n=1 Tax=Actinoplanes philippinensis TaxID=35752 RepID=UPI0034005E46